VFGLRRRHQRDHEVGQLLDRDVGTERAGSRPHDLLDRLVLAPLELLGPQQAKDDPLVVHDHARVPSGRPHPLADLADRFVEPTGRHVPAGHITSSWPVGVPALGRQAGGQPVELTGHVVVDLGEPTALERTRGSWAEVSGRVPAVHDDGPAWVERPSGLGLELAEGQVDRTREVVFLEPFRGQDVDHLGALLHEILNLLPADLPRWTPRSLGPSLTADHLDVNEHASSSSTGPHRTSCLRDPGTPAAARQSCCESALSPARARTRITEGSGSNEGLAMVLKLLEAIEGRWRAVNGPYLVTLVPVGARF
jgi:hypothetical protein